MNTQHTATVLEKTGSEWTNDLGQTFPPAQLYRVTCSCGWAGAVWHSKLETALGAFERHAAKAAVTA